MTLASNRNSKETLNYSTKIELAHLKNVPYTGTALIAQGVFVKRNATTQMAELAAVTDQFTYLNWTPSTMMTVKDSQACVLDSTIAPVGLVAGGLSVFEGYGDEFDILTSSMDTTIIGHTPAIGDYLVVGTDSKPAAVAPASIAGLISFGRITRIIGNRTWFVYNSTGVVHP